MNNIIGQYYEPYDSDDSGHTDETEESDLSDSEDPRIRRQEDPRYMILQSPSLNIPAKELSKDNPINPYATYDTSTNITSYKDLVYLNPPKTTKSSLFCVRSDSRDIKIFPSPMNFTIKLPRVYKNINKLQLVQISFPNNTDKNVSADSALTSSFVNYLLKSGIPPCCTSTCITTTCSALNMSAMGMIEQGRLNTSGNPFMTVVSVPDGTYTNSAQLANELTYQANNTPPFNIITYDAFRDTFMNTRDVSILFNEPGDCFSSKTNNKRYGSHTKENIMNTYYTQQHIDSFPEITEVIAFNAYYYPILKELLATQRARPFLNTGHLSFGTIMNLVMGTFEGLQSNIYYEIGQLNQNALDIFRQTLTFELRNINKYQWVYKEDRNQIITIHDTLHTSLHNDIQKTYQTISNQELAQQGFHTNSFKALKTNLLQYNCIYKHLETNLSTVLGNYHFVSGYQYRGGDTYSTIESTFQCMSDLQEDSDFSSMFCYKSTIGRIYGNYTGVPMNFTSFQDYHSTLSSYYTMVQSTNQTISSIHGSIHSQHHEYVSTKYQNILPQNMIQNKSYMMNQGVPVRFVTDHLLYVPGQSILSSNTTNKTTKTTNSSNTTNKTKTTNSSNTTVSTTSFQTLQIPQPNSTMTDINVIVPSISTNIYNLSATTPSSPFITNIIIGDTQLIVQFDVPISDGGSPIIDYKYSIGGDFVSAVTTVSPIIITGLTNGTTYQVTIVAVNLIGTGANSNTVAATPAPDNCNGLCNCFDPTFTCCQYCLNDVGLEGNCNCTSLCCAQIRTLVSSWYSCIPVNTIINTLSYRLGILNLTTGVNMISTATSTMGFNITSTINAILPPINNNLFMSINDEMGFNNMDVAMPEDYSITNETTGQVKLMFAKIMFSGVGKSAESQTLFQNPLEFETPLGKLDRLTFKIYYDDAAITPVWLSTPFPELYSEWNAIVNIEEEIGLASRVTGWSTTPTLPIPTNPNATPYVSYTSSDNPNNKK